MPNSSSYELSYMHKEPVSHILISPKHDYIFTTSSDGYLKFWRKGVQGIEFVKTFRANMAAISSMCISANQLRLATCCPEEKSLKVFDVVNFDLMNMIKVNFTPNLMQFVSKQNMFAPILAVTESESPSIRLIRAEQQLQEKKSEGTQVVMKVKIDMHDQPVTFMRFNHFFNYAVSFAGGVPEVWDPETLELP